MGYDVWAGFDNPDSYGDGYAAAISAFDRWLTLAVKQELANAVAEGQGDFKWI